MVKTIRGMPQSAGKAPEAEELVRSMGLIFTNTFLYGHAHGITKKAIKDGFDVLGRVLKSCEEIVFSITDDGLFVNGHIVEQKNPLIRKFITQLKSLEVNSFSIIRGMTWEKFEKLIDIMNTKPEKIKESGGFPRVVADSGLENVRAKAVVFQQISEDEVVVSHEELKKADISRQVFEDWAAAFQRKQEAPVSDQQVAEVQEAAPKKEAKEVQEVELEKEAEEAATVDKSAKAVEILAFLKGDVSAKDKNVLESVKEAASDAQKLSQLILQAAEIRQKAADLEGGESMADLVVGCLRRVFDGLSKDPAIKKTQKGKKDFSKNLMLLEKEVLDKLHAMSGKVSNEDFGAVSNTIEEMTDELKMDSLAVEYMKKREALEANEKRILRFIKSKGLEKIDDTDLQEKLAEEGLPMDGWQELLVKSGVGSGGGTGVGAGSGGGGMAAIGHLAVLLTHLEETFEKSKHETTEAVEKEATEILTKVDHEVRNLAVRTEQRIQDLVKNVRADEEAAEAIEKEARQQGKGPQLSRRKLMVLLAEIVQELCQPLAVINCSIDMIRLRNLGAVTEQQEHMLELASSSGERLKKLIDRLMEISGVPTALEPDAAIQASLY